MYEFYKKETDSELLSESRKKLRSLYKQVPDTKGCMENIAKEDGCGAWCCVKQNPQLMYVEFLNTWHNILKNEAPDKIASLVIKAVRKYLDNAPTKGCMMHDKDTKQCTIHFTRPLNCRMYSQIPEEEFKPRYERLKVLYQNIPDAIIMPQCDLTETIGDKPTIEQSDRWQKELEKIEQSVGIPKNQITDEENGSYRTFQDHILLRMCGASFLARLTVVKLTGTKEAQEQFVKELVQNMRKTHPLLEDVKDTEVKSQIVIVS